MWRLSWRRERTGDRSKTRKLHLEQLCCSCPIDILTDSCIPLIWFLSSKFMIEYADRILINFEIQKWRNPRIFVVSIGQVSRYVSAWNAFANSLTNRWTKIATVLEVVYDLNAWSIKQCRTRRVMKTFDLLRNLVKNDTWIITILLACYQGWVW